MLWYELAYVAGVTHALNTVADGLGLAPEFEPGTRTPRVPLPPAAGAEGEVKALFDEIRAFYAVDEPPAVFRWMARDPGYWGATRAAFADRKLPRSFKEVLALAASLTARSDYGVDLHLREARRLGLSEAGLTEVVEVVQLFNTVTKIADTLWLEPDFPARPAVPGA